MAYEDARRRLMRVGKIVTALGALLLLYVVGVTAWGAVTRVEPACRADTPIPPTAAIAYAPDQVLKLKGHLCVAVDTAAYFRAELDRKRRLEAALPPLPKPGATPTPADIAAADFGAASERQTAAQQLAALPTEGRLVLFVDERRVPVSFTLPIRDAAPGKTANWMWTRVSLTSPPGGDAEEAVKRADAWRVALVGAGATGERRVRLSLGPPDADVPRFHITADDMRLRVFWPLRVVVGLLGVILFGAGLVVWGWMSGVLRDRKPSADDPNPPFSLGRSQMMWWFLLTMGGFLFIWLTTGQGVNVLTTGVAALVGISGVSGAAAQAIDNLADTPAAHRPQSGGFLTDLLSDGGGVVLHRVQMFAWTVIMGIIFLWEVFSSFRFPVFDNAMLALTGVVSGVYVGFKFPEKESAADATAKPAPGG